MDEAHAMWPNEWLQNEQRKEENELKDKITFERMNNLNNQTSEMPAKPTENDQWHEQTPANLATQQMAEIYLPLFETKKSRWFRI